MKNNSVLCQMNDEGFTEKPTDIKFYGKLRDKMIQKPWSYVTEDEFIRKVTKEGHAFYGCLFDGHDLMETGQQRLCWKTQTLVGVDIDKSDVSPTLMKQFYEVWGLEPWLIYPTFSDDPNGKRSYRLLWRVQVDLNESYEDWAYVIKGMSQLSSEGDPRARDCSRLWQGGLKGPLYHNRSAQPLSYSYLKDKVEVYQERVPA